MAVGDQQQQAFATDKSQLASSEVLVYYGPELQLILSCDASPYWVDAVFAHLWHCSRSIIQA